MEKQCNAASTLVGKKERNWGIDLLRIIAMFMVTLLHFSGKGGFIGTPDSGISFYVITFFKVICFGAVNIFAMISGFVMYNKKVNYTNLINLWFQVAFYSVGLSLVNKFVLGSPFSILGSFTPVLKVKFWYFTAYFFMFFFTPFFNELVEKLSNKAMRFFLLTGFVTLCFGSNFVKYLGHEIFGTVNGYSLLWLSFCYITGAFIAKDKQFFFRLSNGFYSLVAVVCVALTYLNNILLFNAVSPINLNAHPAYFLLIYTSPTVFVSSICLLIIFSRIKISHGTRLIKFFSATSFGVYIIQCHELVWNNFVTKLSTYFSNPGSFEKIFIVLGVSIIFFVLACILDYLRALLFKLFRINNISKFIYKLVAALVSKVKALTMRIYTAFAQ